MGKVKIDLTRQFFRARQFLPGGLLINGTEIPRSRCVEAATPGGGIAMRKKRDAVR
jgi:hypothetical protein